MSLKLTVTLLLLARVLAAAAPRVEVEPPVPLPGQSFLVRAVYESHCLLDAELEVDGDLLRVVTTEACHCSDDAVEVSLEFQAPALDEGLYTAQLAVAKQEEGLICGDPPAFVAGTAFAVSSGGLTLAVVPPEPRAGDSVTLAVSSRCPTLFHQLRRSGSLLRLPIDTTSPQPAAPCFEEIAYHLPISLGTLAEGAYSVVVVDAPTGFPRLIQTLTFEVGEAFTGVQVLGDRYHVSVLYATELDLAGEPLFLQASSASFSEDSAWFWFFNEENVEVVVKILDGCTVNGHVWMFASGLTNVGVRIVVRDLATDESRVWESPIGEDFIPILDTHAFASCAP